MTFCRRCGVKLPGDEDVCVLCGSRTERLDDTRRRDYPEIRSSGVFRTVVRLRAGIGGVRHRVAVSQLAL